MVAFGLKKNELKKNYINDGFIIATAHKRHEILSIRDFALDWISLLLEQQITGSLPGPIDEYHLWKGDTSINHNEVLSAQNRHTKPDALIKKKIITDTLIEILNEIEPNYDFKLWDEGLGWLAFRLIRPGYNDGYPWSCKAWGPAKNSMSVWLPVIGCGADETIAFWPGSHRKTFEKFMPDNSKFTKDEFRLKAPPRIEEVVRPTLRENEIIIFGPNTLHSEDVEIGNQTRFNLELRFEMSLKRMA